ncbi:protein kinase domain-containing protein [Nannocystaceae bacterium ST9]
MDTRSSVETDASATATLADTRGAGRSKEPEPPDPARGSNIGRYLVLERLGAGAMGVVFAAYDPELDRRVAIKVLHARHGGERAQARLVREAQALARVTHACVVAVHDVGLHEGRVFLAMEYVEGQTLRAFMADTTRGLDERLRVLLRAGEGLAAAHRAALVHRDFKPDNVMIAASGEVKVMDFGLARASEGESSSLDDERSGSLDAGGPVSRLAATHELTQIGAMVGTPAYMAPEQLASLPADALSDQFAFAVTAYEALYGVRPFVGGNLSALALAISEGRIAEPPKHARVPAWLRRVLLRALASDPGLRWPDLDSLLRAMADDPIRARRRRWFTGGALGLSAGAGALIASLLAGPDPSPAPACDELVAGLEGRWTEAARTELELALGQDAAASSVVQALDDYAAAWDAATFDNCTRTRVELAQSERVHELRAECLRHRQIAFEELVRVLGEGQGERNRAVEAAAHLPAIATCSDVAALELEPAPPSDPTLRGEVELLRDEIAALEPLVELRGGKQRARELAARADELPYPPVQAEAALIAGRALALADLLDEGVARLRQAYFLALTSGHARTQARAATELVYAVGYLQQDHRGGREWAEHALAIVARVDEGGLLEADVQHSLAVLLDAAGDHGAALAANGRAYAIRRRLLPVNHPDLARSLNSMGNLHHSLGQLERARSDHEQALAIRTAIFGPDHPITSGSLNNLALTLRDLGELERARELFEQAVASLERSGSQGNNLARSLTNLAEVERRLGHLARARELEQRSLALRRASVGDLHPEVADSIVGLARIALAEGELEQAELHARDGVARLTRDFAAGHPETFAANVVLASVLEARGQIDEAARVLAAAFAESRVEELEASDLAEAKALLRRVGAADPP